MTIDIPEEKMTAYRKSAKKRWLKQLQEKEEWKENAIKLANQLAAILKKDYNAKQVVLFGSLARDDVFDSRSDVDLAVWGLEDSIYYRVLSRLMDINPEIKIDLVMVENASRNIIKTIEEEGKVL